MTTPLGPSENEKPGSPTRSTRAAGGIVVWQRVQPSQQLTHHRELLRAVGKPDAFDEPCHQDRAAIEVRDRIIDR